MIRFPILAALLTIMLLPAGAQVIHIEPALFVQQYEDSVYSDMTYIGRGQFLEFRSCRMDWLDVTFRTVTFDCSTKILTIEGQVMNANPGQESIISSQTLLGSPAAEVERSGNGMTVRTSFANDSTGRFRHAVGPIRPGDRIAFTTPEPASEYGSRVLAWSKVFAVGRLAECTAEGDDGATFGQR